MGGPSLAELYRAYGPSVLRRARALLGDEQSARDAMQEVFIRALRSKVRFREGMSPMTWFYRVTTNYCLNVLRNQGRRTRALSGQSRSEAVPSIADDQIAIRQLLAVVPEELGQIAIYYYVDQMNQDEIAEIIGVSRRTIGNRLEEFKKLARASLSEAVEVS